MSLFNEAAAKHDSNEADTTTENNAAVVGMWEQIKVEVALIEPGKQLRLNVVAILYSGIRWSF